ncbi:MAG: DUF3488 and transglutaminase-like domain-containing protein [Zavarzinella sp.]
MPLLRTFRTGMYLTLMLAVFAIMVSGSDLLIDIPVACIISMILLGIAYFMEGRFELSLKNANIVGFVLFGLLGLWALWQLTLRPPTGLGEILPWPASYLPFVAPVLVLLLPMKMFRPKHMGDYWAMFGLSMLTVALACAMAQDGIFLLVVLIYLFVLVGSLRSFHLLREAGVESAAEIRSSGQKISMVGSVAKSFGLALLVAVPLFWLTPRAPNSWQLGMNTRGQMTTGITDGPVNLNSTGSVSLNRDPVFEVTVQDRQGNPISDLPPDMRWRVSELSKYDDGTWQPARIPTINIIDRVHNPTPDLDKPQPATLADLGPNSRVLTFNMLTEDETPYPLASPVYWVPGQPSPVGGVRLNRFSNWIQAQDGSFRGPVRTFSQSTKNYKQSWVYQPSALSTPFRFDINSRFNMFLTIPNSLKELKPFTINLLEKLAQEGKLSAGTVSRIRERPNPEDWLEISSALSTYLSTAGDYRYTLDLTRTDRKIDPIMDFLLNSKSGHCQRFASSLALMVRSIGIPSRVVMGYLGCEEKAPGRYEVRGEHAHAWVEILVPYRGDAKFLPLHPQYANLRDREGRPVQYPPFAWATLEPTPGGDAGNPQTQSGGFLAQTRRAGEELLQMLVLTYDRESRTKAWGEFRTWVVDKSGWVVLAAIAAIIYGLYFVQFRRRQKLKHRYPKLPNYVLEMAKILRSANVEIEPGETWHEFAVRAQLLLQPNFTAEVASLPLRVVEYYYRNRFGDLPGDPALEATLINELAAFRRLL